MLVAIPQILTSGHIREFRAELEAARWFDGRATTGYQSARVKANQQLQETDPLARRLGEIVLEALERTPLFMSAALPRKVLPPLFNRYREGENYGSHVDGAIRPVGGTPHRIRTDLSATLFLSNPEDYDGGELVIEDLYGEHRVKLQAGDLILYPATSLHRVDPVTRGERLASFFWIQSMVREDGQRTLLFELDTVIRRLATALPGDPEVVRLLHIYHNMLRMWADA